MKNIVLIITIVSICACTHTKYRYRGISTGGKYRFTLTFYENNKFVHTHKRKNKTISDSGTVEWKMDTAILHYKKPRNMSNLSEVDTFVLSSKRSKEYLSYKHRGLKRRFLISTSAVTPF
jgi:hypothetical protein